MSDSENDYGSEEEFSDNEEGQLDTIWLLPEEFDARLPSLLNSSSRRKKTLQNLFPHLADRIYRCSEYPNGVYINQYGEVMLDDPRTGVYQRMTHEMVQEEKGKVDDITADDDDDGDLEEEEEEDEDDNDEAYDADDAYYELEEQEHKKKRKRKSCYSDDDEDFVLTETQKEEEKEVPLDYDEEDWEEEEESTEEPKKKKQKIDVDTTVAEPQQPLTVEEKKTKFLDDLKRAAEDHERIHERNLNRQRQHIQVQKWLRQLETWVEDWNVLRKQRQKASKKGQGKVKNNTIKMDYDSRLLLTTPACDFKFRKPDVKGVVVKAKMDCQKMVIVCEDDCKAEFSCMPLLYDYLIQKHFNTG